MLSWRFLYSSVLKSAALERDNSLNSGTSLWASSSIILLHMATVFEFVATDPAYNLKPGKTSVQIRSRCMQGRNKKVDSRRSKQSAVYHEAEQEVKALTLPDSNPAVLSSIRSLRPPPATLVALFPFADSSLAAEAKFRALHAFRNDITNRALRPLKDCVEYSAAEHVSCEILATDAALLHSILATSHAIQDFESPSWTGEPSPSTMLHMQRALSMLQARVSMSGTSLSDGLVHAILNLAMVSAGFHEWDAAVTHLRGLQSMLAFTVKDGFLAARTKLHLKLDRIDLVWILSTGKMPFFAQPIAEWNAVVRPNISSPAGEGRFRPPPHWDARLRNAFDDLQCLCTELNAGVNAHVSYSSTGFQVALNSIQSRLIHVGDCVEHPVQELVRLAMMAFLTPLFAVPGLKMPYGWASRAFQAGMMNSFGDLVKFDMRLRTWLLVAMAMVVDSSEPWLAGVWNCMVGVEEWREAKERVMQVMWIEAVHDQVGEEVVRRLSV